MIDPAVLVVLSSFEHIIGVKGQRDEARHDHRGGDRERELGEQLAGIAGHERQRREHRGQRDGHRDDGEADFLAADRTPP